LAARAATNDSVEPVRQHRGEEKPRRRKKEETTAFFALKPKTYCPAPLGKDQMTKEQRKGGAEHPKHLFNNAKDKIIFRLS